jgi:hypothetical protein
MDFGGVALGSPLERSKHQPAPEQVSVNFRVLIGIISKCHTRPRIAARRRAIGRFERDLQNSKLPTGDVKVAVVQAALLAYDAALRLQKEDLANSCVLEEWIVEAG